MGISEKDKRLAGALAISEGQSPTKLAHLTGLSVRTIQHLKDSGQLNEYAEKCKPELYLGFREVARHVLNEQLSRLSDDERRKKIPDNVLGLWGGISMDKIRDMTAKEAPNMIQINVNPDEILKKYDVAPKTQKDSRTVPEESK